MKGQSIPASLQGRGVNLNQIAYKLNSLNTGRVPSALEDELQDLIDRINAEMDKLYGPGSNGGGPQL